MYCRETAPKLLGMESLAMFETERQSDKELPRTAWEDFVRSQNKLKETSCISPETHGDAGSYFDLHKSTEAERSEC